MKASKVVARAGCLFVLALITISIGCATPSDMVCPLGHVSVAGSPIEMSSPEVDSAQWCEQGELRIKDGPYIAYHVDGSVAASGEFQKGSRSGYWTSWDTDGFVVAEGALVSGAREGPWIFRLGDDLRSMTFFENNLRSGVELTWNEMGVVLFERSYQSGDLNGIERARRSDGSIDVEFSWVAGKREGQQVWRFPNGVVSQKVEAIGGHFEGEARYWYPDGTLRAKVPFERSAFNGTASYLGRTGNITKQEVYSGNKLLEFLEPNATGRLETRECERGTIRKRPVDDTEALVSSTEIWCEVPDSQGRMIRDGWYGYWNEDAIKQISGTYSGGKREGEWKVLDENGSAVSTRSYRAGIAVETDAVRP